MLLSFATMTVGAALVFVYGSERWRQAAAWLTSGGLLLTLFSNMLGVLILPGLAVIAVMRMREHQGPGLSVWRYPLLICGPLFVATIAYYASTLTASAVGDELHGHNRAFSSLALAAHVVYEYAGFDGLGPPRNVLRSNPVAISFVYIPWLLFGMLSTVAAVYFSFRTIRDRRVWYLLLGWLLAFLPGLFASTAFHVQILGRHFAAAFPYLLFAAMFLFRTRISLVLLAAVFLVSDFRLSAVPDYWTDDYRSAVRAVIEKDKQNPGTIDWVADWYTADYYGLALTFPNRADYQEYASTSLPHLATGVYCGGGLTPESVDALLRQQLKLRKFVYVAVSKPDLYDLKHGWRHALERRNAAPVASYRSFRIYVVQ
jgi:hypothetical protein